MIAPERERLDAWSAENPRDDLSLVAIAAWVNTTPDKLPKEMRYHTCAATKEAWARVAHAVTAAAVAAVVERAANKMNPVIRSMISRGEAYDTIRALADPTGLAALEAVKAQVRAEERALWLSAMSDCIPHDLEIAVAERVAVIRGDKP